MRTMPGRRFVYSPAKVLVSCCDSYDGIVLTEVIMKDVIVLGAGPAGMVAALRAGDLGARTTLVTRDDFGGMAANDGPVPVRTLAHAARLMREARQLDREQHLESAV